MNRSLTNVIINFAASHLNENLPSLLTLAARHYGIELSLFVAPGSFHNSGKDLGNPIYLQLLSNKDCVLVFYQKARL